MKQNFENVVKENTSWILAYVRKSAKDISLAEDIVQEIWLKAYRAYDSYDECGRLKAWLARIAKNTVYRFSYGDEEADISLDYETEDLDSMYTYLSDGRTPEDEYIEKELIADVMKHLSALPEQQRKVLVFRYLNGFSVEEVAYIMQIPQGSVKSKAHYGLDELKKRLTKHKTIRKGDYTMKCQDIYKYLMMYVMELLSDDMKATVGAHIAECETCARVASSLKTLLLKIDFGADDERVNYYIEFPDLNLSYQGKRTTLHHYEKYQKWIAEGNGIIPKDERFMDYEYNKTMTLLGTFDNEGNEIEFEVFGETEKTIHMRATYMKKVYPYMWQHKAFLGDRNAKIFRDKPNEYRREVRGYVKGGASKLGYYEAIPAEAESIRIIRGNGVINAGAYKFAYADRYVVEDEQVNLEYRVIMKK